MFGCVVTEVEIVDKDEDKIKMGFWEESWDPLLMF